MDSETSREWLTLAGAFQREADEIGVGRSRQSSLPAEGEVDPAILRFDQLVTNDSLRSASRKLFLNGHYARAVEDAFKCLNNEVKARADRSDLDGDKLMRQVFSANSPILALNPLQSTSEKDEQRGYMDMFAGAMTGIRNPRAHEHDLEDDLDVALEMIVLANHLMRKLDGSVKSP